MFNETNDEMCNVDDPISNILIEWSDSLLPAFICIFYLTDLNFVNLGNYGCRTLKKEKMTLLCLYCYLILLQNDT